jgi:LysM repeat protein
MRLRWFFALLLLGLTTLPLLAQDSAAGYWLEGETLQKYGRLYELSRALDICLEDIIAANADTLTLSADPHRYWDNLPPRLFIPTDAPPCYEIVKLERTSAVITNDTHYFLLLQKTLQAHNVCIEAVHPLFISGGGAGLASPDFQLYIPLDTLPCINEHEERLRYFDADGKWLPTPTYSSDEFITYSYNIRTALQYCVGDVMAANPQVRLFNASMFVEVFVNETMRRCDWVEVQGSYPNSETLFEFSTRLNTCMEVISKANEWVEVYRPLRNNVLHVPQNTPACYDEHGLRIGKNDRARHILANGDAIFDVAQQYNVCLADLFAANPLLDRQGYNIPSVLFIPNTPPCDYTYPIEHTVQADESLVTISKLYNVCFNRIIDATGVENLRYREGVPTEEGYTPTIIAALAKGSIVLIPERPDCYTFDYEANRYEMQTHLCYTEAVDFTQDYSRHEPPISFTYDTDSGNCTEYGEYVNMLTVIYGNQTLTLYQMRPYAFDTLVTVAQCFGVDPYALIETQARYANNSLPSGYIVLPNDYDRECYLRTADERTLVQKARELSYQAGYLDENGVYTVNYQDTLSSIGRTYGYLPQWIADYNRLPGTDMIYYRQQLQLPPHPSLYDLAKVGGAVVGTLVVSGLVFGLYRWRTSGARKRKNDEKIA